MKHEHKKSKTTSTFSKAALLRWINDDPYREAKLIDEIPIKSATLNKIKTGAYTPSDLLGRAIMHIIESN